MQATVIELELRVLYEISRIIGEALNLPQTLERVLAIISDPLAMKRATVTLRDARRGKACCPGMSGQGGGLGCL